MKHGGNRRFYEVSSKRPLVDFSSNINPLGYPSDLESHWTKAFPRVREYPPIFYEEAREHVAQYLGCTAEDVVLGNGVVELIDGIMSLDRPLVLMQPCFGEYEDRGRIRGRKIISIVANEDLTLPEDFEDQVPEHSMVFLGNPNNPTGYRIPKDRLLYMVQELRKKDCFLILDEAFFEFCPIDYDSVHLFREENFKNLFILRAATKFFGLPGVRLGYGCGDRRLVAHLKRTLAPWSVNLFALAATEVIFKDLDFIEKSRQFTATQRKWMLEELGRIPGVQVYPSLSNFILLGIASWREEYFEHLLEKGFLVRTCTSFKGLQTSHIRVAVKGARENRELIDALSDILKGEYDVREETHGHRIQEHGHH